jgi:TonB family protein
LPLPKGVSDYAVGGNGGQYKHQSVGAAAPAPTKRKDESTYVKGNYALTDTILAYVAEVVAIPEVTATYPCGQVALETVIKNNLKYPTKAKEAGISGVVYVEFEVGKDGTISKAKVVRGINPELDAAALEVVKLMGKFTPGTKGGKPVASKLVLPICFMI